MGSDEDEDDVLSPSKTKKKYPYFYKNYISNLNADKSDNKTLE